MKVRTKPVPIKPSSEGLSLEAILNIVDWQIDFYDGEARQVLIKCSNTIYDHLHKDDPPMEHGN